MRRIAFFEDEKTGNFSPIALLRPTFELLCGHWSARERVLQLCSPAEWGAWLRPELVDVYRDEHPRCHINDLEWLKKAPVLLLNGRWLADQMTLAAATPGTAGWVDNDLAWIWIDPADEIVETATSSIGPLLRSLANSKQQRPAAGAMLHYPWDLINNNSRQITHDFEFRSKESALDLSSQSGIVGPVEQLHVDATADIDPFVVIDTRHGPVWIEAGAKIQAFTRIEGPAYIGRDTQTFRANIREGTSIGPVCRVGGEIEESILHGYVNKYHDGFLGHSYVCPWVNLGALTTNSDLKNDYSNVSVPLVGQGIQTGSNKVGCFIGDHTKTALCSLFNTGSSIGIMSLILPGGELLPKHIPSFSRIWHGQLDPLPDGTESALQTAHYAMGRRNQTLTPNLQKLIETVFINTADERERAFQRHNLRH